MVLVGDTPAHIALAESHRQPEIKFVVLSIFPRSPAPHQRNRKRHVLTGRDFQLVYIEWIRRPMPTKE